jgi:hypothetical protein
VDPRFHIRGTYLTTLFIFCSLSLALLSPLSFYLLSALYPTHPHPLYTTDTQSAIVQVTGLIPDLADIIAVFAAPCLSQDKLSEIMHDKDFVTPLHETYWWEAFEWCLAFKHQREIVSPRPLPLTIFPLSSSSDLTVTSYCCSQNLTVFQLSPFGDLAFISCCCSQVSFFLSLKAYSAHLASFRL